MRHPFIASLGLILLAGTSPAWATATLDCHASDKTVDFSIMGIVPHGQGDPLMQVRAELKADPVGLSDKTEPVEMSDENNTQYWLDAEVLNLVFYKEMETAGAFSSTELTIKTVVRAEDDAYFDGTYHLTSYLPAADGKGEPTEMQADGTVSCSVG